jgi:anti-sigma factor RsiW
MNCREVKKYLDTYVDSELEAGRILEVDTHLEECEHCRSIVLLKRKLKSEIRELGQIKAPDYLRNQILAKANPRRKRWRNIIATAVPLAAAAALVMVLVLPGNAPDSEPLSGVVEDLVNRHARQLPMEIQGTDPREAATWFRGKVDFPVRAPLVNLKEATFQGARLSNVRSHQAAHMTYNVDGHPVTLMIFNPQVNGFTGGSHVTVNGKDVILGRRKGYNVAIFMQGDMAYALSSDLSQKRLLKLVRDFSRSW